MRAGASAGRLWEIKKELIKRELGERVLLDELMSKHTSFRIGGLAELYIVARDTEELCRWMGIIRQHEAPYFLLGNGTNILVSDEGIRGLVIKNECQEMRLGEDDGTIVYAEAGASLARLAAQASQAGLSGLEWAIGVPGTVGGAIVTNAGAFGSSIADVLLEVSVLDCDGVVRTLQDDDLGFGYRSSRFLGQKPREVILSTRLSLNKGEKKLIETCLNRYIERRRATQPSELSAGSVFRNPIGGAAGWFIEQAGLKELSVGDAQVSEKHANFIINRGQARAQDVLDLIERVREEVQRRFGVRLELEIELVGDKCQRN